MSTSKWLLSVTSDVSLETCLSIQVTDFAITLSLPIHSLGSSYSDDIWLNSIKWGIVLKQVISTMIQWLLLTCFMIISEAHSLTFWDFSTMKMSLLLLNLHLSQSFPLPLAVSALLLPSSLPSQHYSSFNVEDREDGGGEKGLLESTASPLWQSMHSAGQAFTYWLSYRYMWEFWEEPSKATGRNWYQHIIGKKAEFWLYRGFKSAPWLSQV